MCWCFVAVFESVDAPRFEDMFDGSLPEIAEAARLADPAVVDAVRGWKQTEAAASARKLAMMAELFVRRTGLPAGEREQWWVDPEASVGAELAAAAGTTQSMALHQTHRGVALRDRLPAVAALFEAGLITDLLVRAIVWRTDLIIDEAAIAAVDAALAQRVTRWGALSVIKTEAEIDALVDEHDPGALRRCRESASSPMMTFGSPSDAAGTTSMWARMYAADAALIEARVTEMAHSVCAADPRSVDERRVAALTALATGSELACACEQSDCPAGPRHNRPTKNTVVYVVTDSAPVDPVDDPVVKPETTTVTPSESGGSATEATSTDQLVDAPREAAVADVATTTARRQCTAPPAFVFGAGVMPNALLGAILDRATIREVRHPGVSSPPEPRYTPSRRTSEFVRCRDLTCRFPGCDKPAQFCDLDHTVPYPVGPTHPSNLKCLCRFHHLLKTFWTGRDGWRDRQYPDGTVEWTSPTGHTYVTYPGSKHLFARLCEPTATLWTGDPPEAEATEADRGAMMPKRRHTRAHTTAKAIEVERRLNDEYVAERNKPPPF